MSNFWVMNDMLVQFLHLHAALGLLLQWCPPKWQQDDSQNGLKSESNARPLAPKARIIPLDH